MIKREFYKERNDGVKLYKTYSDESYRIQKVGTDEIYDEAIDVFPIQYNYEETTEKIETEEISEVEQKAQAYNILVGEVE